MLIKEGAYDRKKDAEAMPVAATAPAAVAVIGANVMGNWGLGELMPKAPSPNFLALANRRVLGAFPGLNAALSVYRNRLGLESDRLDDALEALSAASLAATVGADIAPQVWAMRGNPKAGLPALGTSVAKALFRHGMMPVLGSLSGSRAAAAMGDTLDRRERYYGQRERYLDGLMRREQYCIGERPEDSRTDIGGKDAFG